MRRRRARITVQRMMAAVFIAGVVVGGTSALDRAGMKRAAYRVMAYHVGSSERNRRSLAYAYAAQAVATREWVAAGAQGHPPGEVGKEGRKREDPEIAYTFGPKEVEEWRRLPELATAAAGRFEREAVRLAEEATDFARRRREYERSASYPWVFFAPVPDAK